MKRIGWLMVLAAAVAGCSVIDNMATWLGWKIAPADMVGHVIFDSYTQTTDFGFELHGMYIDEDGIVWRYELDQPWYPDEMRGGVIGEDDLLRKIADAERIGSVSPRVLAEQIELIPAAQEAKTIRDWQSYERGGALDLVYTYEPVRKNYKQVILKGTGDWTARNTSRESRMLLAWLNEVKKKVGYED